MPATLAHAPSTRAPTRARRGNTRAQLGQLWQLPLLLLSLGLFGYAAYLFIDPKPGLTIDQKIAIARQFLNQERPKAALDQLNKIIQTERLENDQQAKVHLMTAEALDMGQRERRISIPINHKRIIEQTQLALARGAKGDMAVYRRLGESYEALGKTVEALSAYRRAMSLDTNKTMSIQRKVIDLQLAQDDPTPAEATLDEYLKNRTITNAERAWAMGEKAQLLIDAGKYLDARSLLSQAMALEIDPVAQGTLNYRMGYSAYRLGDPGEAERYLRVARDQLKVMHPLDAEAAVLLGRICRDRNDPVEAAAFYQDVLTSHPDSPAAPLARLGRGLCRIMQRQDESGLSDLHTLVDEVSQKQSRKRYREDMIQGMRQAGALLAARENYAGAIEVLAYEQSLNTDPAPGFFARLGDVYEKRADQLDKQIAAAAPADRIRLDQQIREYRTRAGDAYVAYSRGLTLNDDKGYGEAMWRGIDLYERAQNLQCVISALDLFVTERPEDPLTPDALLRLGRAYQAGGLFDKAIAAYQRNQLRYPNSLAASKSAVPLAQAYIAKGPESFGKAEAALLSVVNNNPRLTPESEEFREALFELAQLLYRTNRFAEATQRLEEFINRYDKDERMGQLQFLMADGYRKSALELNAKLATAQVAGAQANAGGNVGPGLDVAEAQAAKRERLQKARHLYDTVIDGYRARPPATDVDKLYQKLSHFYRADCVYDLGDYNEAISLYDAAITRYQDDPSALAAYMQIVNAYCAMGKVQDAKTATERAKWLLSRIPPDAFDRGTFAMPKEYWQQWLKWATDAGMW